MIRDFFSYQKFDIDTRIEDEGRTDPRTLLTAHEFDKPGMILSNDDVKVSTFLVRHPPIKQSYAYRFDAWDRSVVIPKGADARTFVGEGCNRNEYSKSA